MSPNDIERVTAIRNKAKRLYWSFYTEDPNSFETLKEVEDFLYEVGFQLSELLDEPQVPALFKSKEGNE